MEFNSIAMIETNGLVSAYTALEVMLKLGEVKFLKKEIISNGQVTILVYGNVPALNAVLEKAKIAANNVGKVITSSIIENPDEEFLALILDKKLQNGTKPSKSAKNVKKDEIITLFDDIESSIPVSTKNLVKNAPTESKVEDAPQVVEDKFENSVAPEILIEESEKVVPNELFFDIPDSTFVTETVNEPIEIDNSETAIVDSELTNPSEVFFEQLEISDAPKMVFEETEIYDAPEIVIEEKLSETEIDLNNLSNLSHLERLRAEAKLEINNGHSDKKETSNENINEYLQMNVHELRRLARNHPNFPIKGREISKANRGILIDYFSKI
jgi:ethanolamine utilization protein EutM